MKRKKNDDEIRDKRSRGFFNFFKQQSNREFVVQQIKDAFLKFFSLLLFLKSLKNKNRKKTKINSLLHNNNIMFLSK
jgi:hypothetical protein